MLTTTPNAVIRAVVVDDEPLARLRLRTLLADHTDFAVVAECADGREAIAAVGREHPDVIFLDVQMAEMSGMEVARALEGPGSPTVVFVTAYDEYAVRAFELHAIDYLLKPFDEDRFTRALERVRAQRAGATTEQAHARLLTLLREISRGAVPASDAAAALPTVRPSLLYVGDIAVDLRARVVKRDGRTIQLRPKEFDLLVALMRRAGDVVGRRELLHDVWGYHDDVASRTVDTHVAELRRKLGHVAGQPGHIATVARTGYRLDV